MIIEEPEAISVEFITLEPVKAANPEIIEKPINAPAPKIKPKPRPKPKAKPVIQKPVEEASLPLPIPEAESIVEPIREPVVEPLQDAVIEPAPLPEIDFRPTPDILSQPLQEPEPEALAAPEFLPVEEPEIEPEIAPTPIIEFYEPLIQEPPEVLPEIIPEPIFEPLVEPEALPEPLPEIIQPIFEEPILEEPLPELPAIEDLPPLPEPEPEPKPLPEPEPEPEPKPELLPEILTTAPTILASPEQPITLDEVKDAIPESQADRELEKQEIKRQKREARAQRRLEKDTAREQQRQIERQAREDRQREREARKQQRREAKDRASRARDAAKDAKRTSERAAREKAAASKSPAQDNAGPSVPKPPRRSTLSGPASGGGNPPPSGTRAVAPGTKGWGLSTGPQTQSPGQGYENLNLDIRCREADKTHLECPEYLKKFRGRNNAGVESFDGMAGRGTDSGPQIRSLATGNAVGRVIGGGGDPWSSGIGNSSVNNGGPSTTVLDDPANSFDRSFPGKDFDYGQNDGARLRDLITEPDGEEDDALDILTLPATPDNSPR